MAVSEKGIAELSGNRSVIFITKEQIQNIEIKFGSQAERPIVQGILGIALVGLGEVGISMVAAVGLVAIRWSLG